MVQCKRVAIVASGPSARGFVPPPDVTVIAVNGTIGWLSRADYWFTLDQSPANVKRMRNPRPGVTYCAASEGALPSRVLRYNRIAGQGTEPDRGTPEWWLWRWRSVLTLCSDVGCIHTGNSAWGALGLAYHLGAERVALVGVDADSRPRIEGGRCNNLSHLPLLFNSAIGQIDMVNCGNMQSNVPSMPISRGMDWLVE